MDNGTVIYKYAISITDTQEVYMPEGASILCAQMQNGTLCLWAKVHPQLDKLPRTIRIIGTGNPFPDSYWCDYIGTVQDAQFVWHVFERGD